MTLQSREIELFEQVLPLFNALGDPTRQHIVRHLSYQPALNVGELTLRTELSRPAVSHHLKVLREAGLVIEYKEGTKRYYRPTFSRYTNPLRELINCVEKIEKEVERQEKEN